MATLCEHPCRREWALPLRTGAGRRGAQGGATEISRREGPPRDAPQAVDAAATPGGGRRREDGSGGGGGSSTRLEGSGIGIRCAAAG